MAKSDLKVVITPGKEAEAVTVALIGEARVDMDTCNEYMERVLVLEPRAIVVDASQLMFISSTGICLLINLRNAMRAVKGKVTLKGLRPLVRKALEAAHVLQLFDVPA